MQGTGNALLASESPFNRPALEPSLQRRGVQLLILVMSVIAFAPGLTSPLTRLDDPMYTYLHKEITAPGLAGFLSVWDSSNAWNGRFIEFFPLRDSVYWLIFQNWGALGTPYHLASLLFHIIASLLVFQLFARFGQSLWVAAVGALLFAVHPIHAESVTWVAGLKDPMYTTFVLVSLLAFIKYRQSNSRAQYVLMLVSLVAALLVKSMAIATPVLMVVIDRLLEPRGGKWKTTVLRVVAPAAVTAVFLVQFISIGHANNVPHVLHGGTLRSHVVLSAWAQFVYVKQAVMPAYFHVLPCFAPVETWADPRLLAAIALACAIGIAVFVWRNTPIRLLAVAFYGACMLPVSNLMPLPDLMADRYLYTASIGVCLLAALLIEANLSRLKNVIAVLAILTGTATTFFHTFSWQDEEQLYIEGDEDPVCMVDPLHPAGQVHVLRYFTAKDEETRFAAAERTINSEGIKNDHSGVICTIWKDGIKMAAHRGEMEKAQLWARRLLTYCPETAR